MRAYGWVVLLLWGCQEYELHGPADVVPSGDGPVLRVEPTAVDFGDVTLGEDALHEVTVTNVGVGTLTLEPLVLSDPGGVFTLAPLDHVALGSEESGRFSVTFTPNEPGVAQGAVTVASDAPLEGVVDVSLVGAGVEPVFESRTYAIELFLTADDAWEGWVDGVPLQGSSQTTWTHADTFEMDLDSGDHVLAIRAWDTGSVISGLIGTIAVDGVDTWITGDGSWMMTSTAPASGWNDIGFDDSSWEPAATCTTQSTWGTYRPVPFYDRGAEWVWWTANCSDLQTAWFRVAFTLP